MATWPHAPSREVTAPGKYIITAATLHKEHFYKGKQRLDLLQDILLHVLEEQGWSVQAWAVFPNHYHFVGFSPESGLDRGDLTSRIHGKAAIELNKLDGTPGRQVWYRAWDSRLTYPKSYLARLAYVHANAVKHGLVDDPVQYPWCSARWFRDHGHRPFVDTVMSFKTDTVKVIDDF